MKKSEGLEEKKGKLIKERDYWLKTMRNLNLDLWKKSIKPKNKLKISLNKFDKKRIDIELWKVKLINCKEKIKNWQRLLKPNLKKRKEKFCERFCGNENFKR